MQSLVSAGVHLSRLWDVAAAHRLLCGGYRADPTRAWAHAHNLDRTAMPSHTNDLFGQLDDSEEPVLSSGYLSPWWAATVSPPDRAQQWAAAALTVAARQQAQLQALPRGVTTARSESTAEMLAVELAATGLPLDTTIAETIISNAAGPRPRNEADAIAQRIRRDNEVLAHAPVGLTADLRSPLQVRSLVRALGYDLPDTRAWRLEQLRGQDPLIDALLVWRKAERFATTYGYAWLDTHVTNGRLHGAWTACDGAAGRMTASAGLHSMPADLRPAVLAEAGYVFVRADLGQIEPRVLAVVAGDPQLAAATREPDLYQPVAKALGVDRPTAKVAVLGAMYGQTTGHGATALRRLHAAYPVAMAYLDAADKAGQRGEDLRTFGGRLIRLNVGDDEASMAASDARYRAGSRGRYARNAMIQGAAAEFFKRWAVTVRARCRSLGAEIVLCLHDELLVHVPTDAAEATVDLLRTTLLETARGWAPDDAVHFTADIGIVERWSDAK